MSQTRAELSAPRVDTSAGHLLERCRGWLVNRFDESLHVLLERVDHTLFSLTEEGCDDPARPVYFEVMRDIRKRREAMRGATEGELSARLGAALRAEPLTEQPGESALDPGGILALDAMANRVRLACRDNSLRPRRAFAALLRKHLGHGGDAGPRASHDALDPLLFCAAVQHAATALEVEPRTRLVFLKLIERHLAPELIKVYDELTVWFANEGIDALDTLGVQLDEAASATPMSELKLALRRLLRHMPPPPSAAPWRNETEDTTTPGAALYQQLRQELSRAGPNTEAFQQLLTELSYPPRARRGACEPTFELLLELAIAHLPENLRGVVSIARLPLADLHRQAPGWHERTTHPARIWLRTVAGLPVPPAESGTPAAQLNGALRLSLVRLLQPEPDWRGSTAALCAVLQERPSIETARAHVDHDVAARLGAAQTVDLPIRHFVNRYWQELLVTRFLSDGGAGPSYQQAAGLLDTLAWCLRTDPEADVRRRQTEALPALLHELETGLRDVGLTNTESAEVAAGLLASANERESVPDRMSPSDRRDRVGSARLAGVLRDAFERANLHVYKTARDKAGCKGMAASAAAVLLSGSTASIAHIGDARAYRLRDTRLEPLGHDHSVANQSLASDSVPSRDTGPGKAGSGESAALRVLTRSLGESDQVRVDVCSIALAHNDRILICTDGLSDTLPFGTLETALAAERDPGAAVATLKNALAGRNEDHATFCVIGCTAPGTSPMIAHMEHASVVGTARSANEDSAHCDGRLGLAIVSDGSGSRGAGAIAAGMVVYTVAEQIEKGLRRLPQASAPAAAGEPDAPWDERRPVPGHAA